MRRVLVVTAALAAVPLHAQRTVAPGASIAAVPSFSAPQAAFPGARLSFPAPGLSYSLAPAAVDPVLMAASMAAAPDLALLRPAGLDAPEPQGLRALPATRRLLAGLVLAADVPAERLYMATNDLFDGNDRDGEDDGLQPDMAKAKGFRPQPGGSPYTDEQIVAMAQSFAKSMKGTPYSYTEYNAELYGNIEELRQKGVPARQIDLYKKTCDDYPGREFNPWSGD